MLREIVSLDFYVIVSCVSLTILLIVKTIHPRRWLDFFSFLGQSNYLKIYIKEHTFFDTFDTLLFVNFCMNMATLIWLISASNYGLSELSLTSFLGIFGIIAIWYLAKTGLELLIGYAFDVYTLFNVLTFQQISSLNFCGILLLPINCILIFDSHITTQAIGVSLTIVTLVLIFGMVKSIRSYNNAIGANIFYFILYICALEIAPFIIVFNYLDQSKIFKI